MTITRTAQLTTKRGPAEYFTGAVWLDDLTGGAPSRVKVARVSFEPGARTAWHTHPHGQTIWITEGVGLCQREGGPIEVVRPGDRVFFEPGAHHWHGATAGRFMVHVAMHQADDTGSNVTWGDHVTDEQYAAQPPLDG